MDDAAGTVVGSRSHYLRAVAERERLEQVLHLIAGSDRLASPETAARTLAESVSLLTHAALVVVSVPDLLDAPIVRADRPSDTPWTALVERFAGDPEAPVQRYVRDVTSAAAPSGLAALAYDAAGLRSLLVVRVVAPGGGALGTLLVGHRRAGALSARQIGLVESLVAHLGQDLEASGALRAQTRIATALQESLLPPVLPHIDGLDLATRYRPSGHGNLVGGDFYDVFGDGHGSWFVLLGDASGIGPEAAGLAGIARYTARALADAALGPGEILEAMNRAVLRAAADERFCTAVLAELVRGPGGSFRATIASAGHPPALVLSADGEVTAATASTGTALGILAQARIGEATTVLSAGESLVLYTDGVIEARDEAGGELGEGGLRRLLGSAGQRSAEGLARRIERAALDHRAAERRDDVAVAVVRVRPNADAATAAP